MSSTSNASRRRGAYPGDRRPFAEEFRLLGVAPNATWEEVRQAYIDLVRVWHPDRFQSDPALRDRAQQRIQQINDAYHELKDAGIFGGPAEPPPPPQPPPPQAHPVPPDESKTPPACAKPPRR